MCNSIFINKKTVPKAKDGEEFEVTVKGVYRTEDGVRKLDVLEVDDQKVVDPKASESECGCGEDHNAEDALTIFLMKPKEE